MQVLVREPRILVRGREHEDRLDDFAEAVRAGLSASPKSLPCRFLYDAAGSALFDQICELPEYYPTRAEAEILRERAGELVALLGGPHDLVELGSGSATKTRHVIDALLGRHGALRYVPLDISRSALEESARRLLADYPELEVSALACEYTEGLAELAASDSRARLVLWLGSNVGNFTRPQAVEFLERVAATMGPDDALLMGVDLRKAPAVLEAAYDDAAGVTARFNKNLLARINRELGGRFDLERFRHRARYRIEPGCVEIDLVSERAQEVPIEALELCVRFEAGESIHTENSFKYSYGEIDELARRAGLGVRRRWTDGQARFSVNLLARA